MNPIKKLATSALAALSGPRVIEATDHIIDTGRYGRFLPGPEVSRYLRDVTFVGKLREAIDGLASHTTTRAQAASKLREALEFLPEEMKSRPPCLDIGQRLAHTYGAVLECIATNIEGMAPLTVEVGLMTDTLKQVEAAMSGHLVFAQRAPDANTITEDHPIHPDHPKNRAIWGFDRDRAMGR